MAFCPQCRSEFREGVARCANCDTDLVDALGSDGEICASQDSMAAWLAGKDLRAVVVGAFAAVSQAQGFLAKAEVPSLIAPEDEEAVPEPGMHQRLYLLVAQDHVERVETLFRERWEAGLAMEGAMVGDAVAPERVASQACPACGADVPASADECPECGLFVGALEGSEG